MGGRAMDVQELAREGLAASVGGVIGWAVTALNMGRRIRDLEIALYGPDGANGIRSDMREIKAMVGEISAQLGSLTVRVGVDEERVAMLRRTIERQGEP